MDLLVLLPVHCRSCATRSTPNRSCLTFCTDHSLSSICVNASFVFRHRGILYGKGMGDEHSSLVRRPTYFEFIINTMSHRSITHDARKIQPVRSEGEGREIRDRFHYHRRFFPGRSIYPTRCPVNPTS